MTPSGPQTGPGCHGSALGGKGHPSRVPIRACQDFSSCPRPHWGELPTPRCLCTELGVGAWRKASPSPQPAIHSAAPGQGFNSAFSHICHVASASCSISHPHPPDWRMVTVPRANIPCHQSLQHPWLKGVQRAPYPCFWGGFGGGASRPAWSSEGKQCGAVGGTVGSSPQRKGSLKQGRAFAVRSVAGGRRHAQQPALCHRRRASRAGQGSHPSWWSAV